MSAILLNPGYTENITLVFGASLSAATILYLVANGKQRLLFIYRLLKRPLRRFWSASTPPSDEKQPPKYSISEALPPLRRQFLSEIVKTAPSEKNDRTGVDGDINEETVRQSMLPLTANYATSPGNLFTPTGFSVDEIKSLGDFPDYAKLSGIPLPDVYPEFDIDKALARPYRTFRWNYHQTMSLMKMEHNWWIELENTYRHRVKQRQEIHAQFGKNVLDYLPGSELACKELLEMVLQFVSTRYPHYFSLSDDKKTFRNSILDKTEDIKAKHPLKILLDNIPEDFAIMERDDKTGSYFLRAGVVCSSLGWTLGSKMGLELHEIHDPIPDYKEKMQFSMGRYFSKMPTDKPIQRGSWGYEVEQPIFVHPTDPYVMYRASQDPSLTLPSCNLHVNWQTLRRLPLSGAIVFNFKALFTPVTEFRNEPGVPALAAKLLRETKQNIMDYKKALHVAHVVLPELDKWAEEQVEQGIVDKDWEVSTLDEAPYFKGWKEKWHRQQGF